MKSFVSSIVAALLIAGGAMYVLDAKVQRRADQAFPNTSVRLPDHGMTHNLVGKDWLTSRDH